MLQPTQYLVVQLLEVCLTISSLSSALALQVTEITGKAAQ
jgi:hypothetical protein